MEDIELLRQRIESSRRFLKEELLEHGFERFYAELLESDQAALNEIEKKNGQRTSGWMWSKQDST